jgi:hypothetical protein
VLPAHRVCLQFSRESNGGERFLSPCQHRFVSLRHAQANPFTPMAYVRASMWHPCGTRGTLKKGCKRPVHRRLGTVAPFFAKNPVRACRLAYDTRYALPIRHLCTSPSCVHSYHLLTCAPVGAATEKTGYANMALNTFTGAKLAECAIHQ